MWTDKDQDGLGKVKKIEIVFKSFHSRLVSDDHGKPFYCR